QQIRSKEGNLFVSPYSISTALAMTYAGARDNTAAEMARVLHFNVNPDRLHPAMGALIRDLNERKRTKRRRNDPDRDKKPFELRTVNTLWGQNGYSFEKPFLDLTRDSYGAGLKRMDFQNQSEKSRLEINRWVEEQTQDRIKDLIPKPDITRDTRLVLTNAIYFKSAWATPFDARWTREETFHLDTNRKITVPIMHRSAHFKAHDAGTHTVLAVPYKGQQLEMVLIVPKEVDGLSRVEKTLTPEALSGWMSKLGRSTRYDLGLPRFKSTPPRFDLKETLQKMGMKDAFQPKKANFKGITNTEPIWIDKVIHKAVVDVDESGTEATAATAVLMTRSGVPKTPVPLQVDRPFLFLIRDQQTGSILFMGRILDPR
ncbi:MAG: serpin family protein, partial [Planctomycetota bacterium]|nr:serpin family protein [Planctomycetota bacterium]